ncbi:MAG: hypothetical protein HYX38_20690 [Rhodospirillales bacterium]|nr:hypothetical protein [Rhodospirillales bacterium]
MDLRYLRDEGDLTQSTQTVDEERRTFLPATEAVPNPDRNLIFPVHSELIAKNGIAWTSAPSRERGRSQASGEGGERTP